MSPLTALVAKLPAPIQPYAKAVVPVAVAGVAALSAWVATGTFDATEINLAVSGLLASLIVGAVPNAEH